MNPGFLVKVAGLSEKKEVIELTFGTGEPTKNAAENADSSPVSPEKESFNLGLTPIGSKQRFWSNEGNSQVDQNKKEPIDLGKKKPARRSEKPRRGTTAPVPVRRRMPKDDSSGIAEKYQQAAAEKPRFPAANTLIGPARRPLRIESRTKLGGSSRFRAHRRPDHRDSSNTSTAPNSQHVNKVFFLRPSLPTCRPGAA